MNQPHHRLFNQDILGSYVEEVARNPPPQAEEFIEVLQSWARYIGRSSDLGEQSLEQAFNNDFFGRILGYAQPPGHRGHFQFFPKSYALAGEGFPDFILGQFKLAKGGDLEKDVRIAVGELKGPGINLDRIDPTRMKSPVEQAFEYSIRNGLALRWVIVSNMRQIRLYHHTSIDHYEEWNIGDLAEQEHLTREFWKLHYLLHRDSLLGWPEPSRLENLLRVSLSERLKLTDDFYAFYRQVISDTYGKMASARPDLAQTPEGRAQLVQASQLLTHRGLVVCFFSDHPAELLPPQTLDRIIGAALELPSLSHTRVYDALDDFFQCLDKGSPKNYSIPIFGYDGGLFQPHPVLDSMTLSDSLFTKSYTIGTRRVDGIFGFRVFDFHTDLNEHLLGRIFEESVGDLEVIHDALQVSEDPLRGLETRREYGLFYTREGLANFVSERAIRDVLVDVRAQTQRDVLGTASTEESSPEREGTLLREYLKRILDLRIADLACGSGAFLVSCYRELSREASRVYEKLRMTKEGQSTLQDFAEFESDLLRRCIYGNDLMPEAVEISKLSLWLASARKDMPLGGLEDNFLSVDSLATVASFPRIGKHQNGFPEFDLVIGNPPWGGKVSIDAREFVEGVYDSLDTEHMDSYELFLLMASRYLRDGGRLCYVLPHTFLYPEHRTTRNYLLGKYQIERYHNLGADWFGPTVRMSTTVLQIRNQQPKEDHTFKSMILVDEDRRRAIKGEASLAQLEEAYAYRIPQSRCARLGDVELFRYVEDDEIMAQMQSVSVPLGVLSSSARGVELGKDGHIIQCPSCGLWDSPPRKKRGGGYASKRCSHCSHTYTIDKALSQTHIVTENPADGDARYIDGDSFQGRYRSLSYKGILLGFDGINYKDPESYSGEKVLIRQAGVGLSVAIDRQGAYCPQSVYIYRFLTDRGNLKMKFMKSVDPGSWADAREIPEDAFGRLDDRFMLALLNSRIFHYYVFKRFGEIDAAQAFAKLTHDKIRSLPVPILELKSQDGVRAYERILSAVDRLLSGEPSGSKADWGIDRDLAKLYGLDGNQQAHANLQLGLVAYHKAMRSLFPSGPPPRPQGQVPLSISVKGT